MGSKSNSTRASHSQCVRAAPLVRVEAIMQWSGAPVYGDCDCDFGFDSQSGAASREELASGNDKMDRLHFMQGTMADTYTVHSDGPTSIPHPALRED